MTFEVSAALITYNHRPYIEQAVLSAVEQIDVPAYQVVVIDDNSSDGTREILQRLAAQFPERVRLVLNETQLGPARTFLKLMNGAAATARYVAYLEGDDYWSDRRKIAKQWEAMKAHPGWSMCFHDCLQISVPGKFRPYRHSGVDVVQELTLADLAVNNFIPSVTVMYRAGLWLPVPPWYEAAYLGDWLFHALVARHGPIGYLPDVMAVHRQHQRGAWSGLSFQQSLTRRQQAYGLLLEHFDPAFAPRIRLALGTLWLTRALHALREARVADARHAAQEALALGVDLRDRAVWRRVFREQPTHLRHFGRLL